MNKITIYPKNLEQTYEIKAWLNEHIGMTNYREWLAFGIYDESKLRRTFSFNNPADESLFLLRWS